MNLGNIINEEGFIVEVVAYNNNSIYMYELQKGEMLIKDEIPAGMLKPRWSGKIWIEGATKEELNKHNKELEEEKKKQEELEQKELNKEDEMANYILELEARLSALEMEGK